MKIKKVLLFQNGGLVSDLLALLKQLFALLLPSLAETESTHNNSETSHKSCKHILGADETEERRRMCALFPELAPATSSDSALEPNECLSTDHIRVGLSDIWLATLRLLVNAMHDSENIVTDFIDCDDSSLTTSASLAFILDVFNKLCQWRKKTKVTEVEDSPQEVNIR